MECPRCHQDNPPVERTGKGEVMSKVWFITGASRGLGAEIARAAIDAGYDVVATARESSAVERALGNSSHLMPVALDVTRRGAPERREGGRRALRPD